MNKTIKRTLAGLFLITLAVNLFAQDKNQEKTASESDKKNYAGWIDSSKKDFSVKFGNIRMNAKPRLGTFNISVVNENGKKIPVLNSGNEYVSSGFYLKANNKIYKLISESNIKTAARKTSTGMQFVYSVKNVADVFVDFKCIQSSPEKDYDMIKISASVTNTGKKKTDFALKVILDTVLGETGTEHFYTSADIPIKSEVIYRTMQNEKWFASKNNQANMQILLDGGDITAPEVVALANYSTLEKNTWEPEMLSFRTFDTVLSYNNSAVGIIWPSKKVDVDAYYTNRFYLGFATGEDIPQGDVYVASLSKDAIDLIESVDKIGKENKDSDIDDKVQLVDVEVNTAIKPVAPVTPVEIVVTPLSTVSQANKTETKYTPEYIQSLIDRISTLQSNPDLASEDEIELLNAELDAILQALM